MDKKMLEYRTKHPKCKFCKYLTLEGGEAACDYYYYWMCVLKDKIISWTDIPRFCKYYTVKGENKNEKDVKNNIK